MDENDLIVDWWPKAGTALFVGFAFGYLTSLLQTVVFFSHSWEASVVVYAIITIGIFWAMKRLNSKLSYKTWKQHEKEQKRKEAKD